MNACDLRQSKVQQLMRETGIDFLMLAPSSNMRYLANLKTMPDERLQVVLVPAEGSITLVLPEMYKLAATTVVENRCQILTWDDSTDPVKLIKSVIGTVGKNVCVDEKMWTGHFLQIKEVFPQAEFYPASKVMRDVRMFKDKNEIHLLSKSAQLVDQIAGELPGVIRPGMTEKELALLIENRMKELGADEPSFKTIVASGPNGAEPHHCTGDRQFTKGDFVIVDFGAIVDHYCSDITRTFCLGKATVEIRKIFNVVKDANEAGFQAALKGCTCEQVDRAARKVIAQAGYGEYFIHRTGHGIGLDYHEEPYIVAGNHKVLEPGMAFSVEPGIYLPGKLGVRIEDIVVVSENGPVRLNRASHELIEI